MRDKVVWQHVGRLFAARTIIGDGWLSAPSQAIEPETSLLRPNKVEYGEGVYRASGIPEELLLVDECAIKFYLKDSIKFGGCSLDHFGRLIVPVQVHRHNMSKVKSVKKAHILPQDWKGNYFEDR